MRRKQNFIFWPKKNHAKFQKQHCPRWMLENAICKRSLKGSQGLLYPRSSSHAPIATVKAKMHCLDLQLMIQMKLDNWILRSFDVRVQSIAENWSRFSPNDPSGCKMSPKLIVSSTGCDVQFWQASKGSPSTLFRKQQINWRPRNEDFSRNPRNPRSLRDGKKNKRETTPDDCLRFDKWYPKQRGEADEGAKFRYPRFCLLDVIFSWGKTITGARKSQCPVQITIVKGWPGHTTPQRTGSGTLLQSFGFAGRNWSIIFHYPFFIPGLSMEKHLLNAELLADLEGSILFSFALFLHFSWIIAK